MFQCRREICMCRIFNVIGMREDDFSRLEINLSNCLMNYRYFRSHLAPETKMLVLVKANAYGHGAVEFASMMEEAGADAIAVHGRTKTQLYQGQSDNAYIRMVKEAVNIPVIGNGDIRTVEDVHRMYEETNCDAIMIGRGLLGRPYFIKEILAEEAGMPYQEPTDGGKIDLCYAYAEKLCAYEEEYTGIHMMRSMAGWFLFGMPYAARYRERLSHVNSLSDLKEVLDDYRRQIE